jgi:hypothetical protein
MKVKRKIVFLSFIMAFFCMLTAMLAMDVRAEWKDKPTSITELEPMIEKPKVTKPKVTKPHEVRFAGIDWYVIGYNDVADTYSDDDDKITLFSKGMMYNARFDYYSNVYSKSNINKLLKEYLEKFSLEQRSAMVKRKLSAIYKSTDDIHSDYVSGESVDAKLWPLSVDEADKLPFFNENRTWLRSPGSSKLYVKFVSNNNGDINSEKVDRINYTRPAVKLKLSSVVYLPESNEIKLIQEIEADDVTVTYGDTDKSVSARVTNPKKGGGEISYAVKEGSEDYIDVDPATGALTIKNVPPDGKAYVTVTAAETETHGPAAKDVTVTIKDGLVTPDETAGSSEAGSVFGGGSGMMIAALSAAALLAMAGVAIFIKRRRK